MTQLVIVALPVLGFRVFIFVGFACAFFVFLTSLCIRLLGLLVGFWPF
jgi:hypothetical protein